MRKLQQQIEQITSELQSERSNAQKMETECEKLGRQNRDLKSKIADFEDQVQTISRTNRQQLEARIVTLEGQLDKVNHSF